VYAQSQNPYQNDQNEVGVFDLSELSVEFLSPRKNGVRKIIPNQSEPRNNVIHLCGGVVDPSREIVLDLRSHIPEIRDDSRCDGFVRVADTFA